MGYNNFKLIIVARVIVITLTITWLVSMFYSESFMLTKGLVAGALIFQLYSLVQFLDRTNRELASFLNAIKYDDFTHSYTTKKTGTSQDLLYEEFNKVIKKFKEIRADKEAQFQYLRTIVHHVGIGIITFNKKGEVQIINAAAKNLLGLELIKNVTQLSSVSEELVSSLLELKTGGRDLLKIEKKGEDIQLAIYAIELMRRDEEFKLISIQNIKSELDEKEMDAWQNLIRVLTHEIMNSVTPISSLAATVEGELEGFLKNDAEINTVSNEDIEDLYLATKTIHRRSKSLIKFVSDFRNLTRIPLPKPEKLSVSNLIEHIMTLLQYDVEKNKIKLTVDVSPKDISIYADREQIEQVLINLIKNAIQAFSEDEKSSDSRTLHIAAFMDKDDKINICVKDNGSGIEEDALKKIFIPFFTTKKSGSGIGLSLSKQIMRKHNGYISVNSELDVGTEFVLKFVS